MEPNYSDGQIVDVDPVELEDLKRGDVILIEDDNGRMFLKRLIGLPSETIEIKNGQILINSAVLDEPYKASSPKYEEARLKLDEDEYYVLGDNRSNSADSHLWGPISGGQIKGRARPK